jgi:hypothetical protein
MSDASASAATAARQRGSAPASARIAPARRTRKPAPGAPSGTSVGKTNLVVAAAATSPAIEKTPSCASPGKPVKTSAAKPISDVKSPSRTVGQLSRRQCSGPAKRLWIR